jgi:hypothetical protein
MSFQPYMDSEGLSCFKEALSHTSCYLEFGCGGSTVYACNETKIENVISVDTDAAWIQRVREEAGSAVKLHLEHVDLGEVGEWGTPKNTERYGEFWKYAVAPWKKATDLNVVPDTVLIDGRFRVACFLYSLLSAKVGTTIIFDDYFNRQKYFASEKYCAIELRAGRVGVFRVSKKFNVSDLAADFAKYVTDWS